ncbi:MAG: T9SS type A sorting domain-containing protein [Bacteroidales bacterium]|nr:T9SS type A sorting domain-containing protein [Bacteroidales bacterium]
MKTKRGLWKGLMMVAAMVAGMGGEAAMAQNIIYSTDFENPANDGEWVLECATQANRWYIDTAEHATGSRGLYISADSGASSCLISSRTSVSYAYHDFAITVPSMYQISFDWRGSLCFEYIYNYARVFIAPREQLAEGILPDTALSIPNLFSATPAGWIEVGRNPNGSIGPLQTYLYWQNLSSEVYVDMGTWRLVFMWCNQSRGDARCSPVACIDNVSILKINCPQPGNLQFVGTPSADSVTVEWTNTSLNCNTWHVALVPWGDSADSCRDIITVYDTFCTITDLTGMMAYDVYVRSVCGWDTSGWTGPLHFATSAYSMHTSGIDTITSCHALITDDGGLNGIYSSNCNGMVIVHSPARDSQMYIIGTCRFDEYGGDYIRIYDGAGTAGNDILFNSQWGYTSFGPLLSSGNAITIRLITNNNYVSSWAEGFKLFVRCRAISECHGPLLLQASALSDSCQLRWSEIYPGTQWCVETGPHGFAPGTGVLDTVRDTSYLLTGLAPSTTYNCYVWASCHGTPTDTAMVTFTTNCTSLARDSLPLRENFDTTGLPACWRFCYYQNGRCFLSNNYARTEGRGATSGPYSLQLNTSTNTQEPVTASFAILPLLDRVPNGFDLSFMMYNTPGSSASVVTMSDPDDSTTYNEVSTVLSDGSYQWREVVVALNNLPAGHRFVALAAMGSTRTLCIDDVLLAPHNNCRRPQSLAMVDSATTDSTTVTWTNTDLGIGMWNLALVLPGGNPDTCGSIVTALDTVYTFTNLPIGVHDVYVRSYCGSQTSEWYGPLTIGVNQYAMRWRKWDTITTCGVLVTDNGGINGRYYGHNSDTLTVRIGAWDSVMLISGSYTTETGYDGLTIYEGEGTSGTMIGLYHGSGTIEPFTTGASAVTLVFTSDAGGNLAGYDISVRCVSPSACNAPVRLAAEPLVDSCTVRWSEFGNSTSWGLEYGPHGFAPGTGTAATAADTSYTITGLRNNTTYDCYIWGYCQGGSTSDTALITFSTLPGRPVDTLPYRCTFGDPVMRSEWGLVNSLMKNKWCIDTAMQRSSADNYSLYVTYDGVTCVCNYMFPAYAYAYRTFRLDAGHYLCSFDWIDNHIDTNWGFMRAAIMPDSIPLNESSACGFGMRSVPAGAIALDGDTALYDNLYTPAWHTCRHSFAIAEPGIYKLVFAWQNKGDGNPAVPGPLAIDSVCLIVDSCERPTELSEAAGPTDATLFWVGYGTFEITYKEATAAEWGDTVLTTGTDTTIANLTPGTAYLWRVRKVCDEGWASEWATSSFTTPQREGIDATAEGVSVDIHPNPTTSDVGVVVTVSGAEGPTTVTLIDVAGRILQRHNATATDHTVQLSLTNIARGAYYITVETPKGSTTKKLIIK